MLNPRATKIAWFPRRDLKYSQLLREERDIPGGSVVTNLPASAGDTSLIPGPGRSHMPWGSSACVLLRPCSGAMNCNKRSTKMRSPWNPRSATGECLQLEKESLQASEDRAQPKINKYFLKNEFATSLSRCPPLPKDFNSCSALNPKTFILEH